MGQLDQFTHFSEGVIEFTVFSSGYIKLLNLKNVCDLKVRYKNCISLVFYSSIMDIIFSFVSFLSKRYWKQKMSFQSNFILSAFLLINNCIGLLFPSLPGSFYFDITFISRCYTILFNDASGISFQMQYHRIICRVEISNLLNYICSGQQMNVKQKKLRINGLHCCVSIAVTFIH